MTTKICKKCKIIHYGDRGMPLPIDLNYLDVINCKHEWKEGMIRKACENCSFICSECCPHDYYEIPNSNGLDTNKKCILCGHLIWWNEESVIKI